jgi:methionyl-tRNA synthetase
MIAAEKAGQTPQQFVADIAAGRKPYLDGFHIGFDNWHSTDGPENHELAQTIYRDLQKAGLIETRTIEQFFDPDKNMFLPDRFIKGQCPKCGAKDQYGDNCESCGAVYSPTELREPYSALSGATPVLKQSDHFFFRLSDPRCIEFLKAWTTSGAVQAEVLNKISEWIAPGEDGKPKMGDWDISRDAPYFGIEILYGRRDDRADPFHRQGHHHLPHPVLAGHAAFFGPQGATPGVRARLFDGQQWRKDE